MALEGDALGAELGELWLCGKSFMPSAAAVVAKANATVAGGANDAAAFQYDGATSPVYPHWDALRDALQRVLADSAENMYETADALVQVVNLYADTDDVAKRRLDGVIERDSRQYPIDDPTTRPGLTDPS